MADRRARRRGKRLAFSITATVNAGTLGQTLVNLAEIVASDLRDPDGSNDRDTAEVKVSAADIAVAKTVDKPIVSEGEQVTFTLVVTNLGPDTATGVEVTDLLPIGLTYVSAEPRATFNSATGVWTIGMLPALVSTTMTLTAVVDAGTSGSTLTNVAEITRSDLLDPNGTNDRAEADVRVESTVAGGGGAAEPCEGKVIISEVAWPGTAADPRDQWIELRNLGEAPVDLTGWTLRWRKKHPVAPEDYQWKTVILSGTVGGATPTACELARQEQKPLLRFEKRTTDTFSWVVYREPETRDPSYYTLERRSEMTISNEPANLVYDPIGPLSHGPDLRR